jgi:hypothetical protein
MTQTIKLSKEDALKIINWYDNEGVKNWGLWGNYPDLPFEASYHSFDTCHCRITFDHPVIIGDETYNGISDHRVVPGKGIYFHIEVLKNEFLDGYRESKNEKRIIEKENAFKNFDLATFKIRVENFPPEMNKNARMSYMKHSLFMSGFQKTPNISWNMGYYLAEQKLRDYGKQA